MTELSTSSSLPQLLNSMRVSVHIMVAGLLLVGFGASVAASTFTPVVACVAGMLSAFYLAGTVLRQHQEVRSRIAYIWLLLVLAVWLCLVTLAVQFVWLLFPFIFVILGVLPRLGGWLTSIVVCALAIYLPTASGQWAVDVGVIIGPSIGTLAAIAIHYFYAALRQEALHHLQVAQQLRSTRAELGMTERKAGELAERERMAREIHDTLAQGLSSIVLLSRAASKQAQPETAEAIKAIEEAASDNLAQARRFVAGRDPELSQQPLSQLLTEVVNKQRAHIRALELNTTIELILPENAREVVAPEIAETAARVVQEALSNALRHADAQHVVVSYGRWPEQITVDIVDDGRGFEPRRIEPTEVSGYGLRGLRTRVEEIGGELNVESSSLGTAIAARLPLKGHRA